jgi:hypothetical protein
MGIDPVALDAQLAGKGGCVGEACRSLLRFGAEYLNDPAGDRLNDPRLDLNLANVHVLIA